MWIGMADIFFLDRQAIAIKLLVPHLDHVPGHSHDTFYIIHAWIIGILKNNYVIVGAFIITIEFIVLIYASIWGVKKDTVKLLKDNQ